MEKGENSDLSLNQRIISLNSDGISESGIVKQLPKTTEEI